ncbi:hypothetical protein ACK3TF_005090 [Chlorella vulgaris]
MRILRDWKDLPKENLLKAFEAGHFAGVEEIKRNGRLSCRWVWFIPPLAVPLVVFQGADDNTIPRDYMKHWRKHTSGTYRHVVLPGGTHYFVSAHYQQVTREVGQESLKIQAQMRGGLLGTGYSWVARPGAGSSDDAALKSNGRHERH